MKRTVKFIVALLLTSYLFAANLVAQNLTDNLPKMYVVTKNDGVKFIGEILSSDAREVLMRTNAIGDVYIPKHEIKEIKEILAGSAKQFVSDDIFATRYFITTNGLPIKKGESYIQWNLYGPDFQFGIADNFGVGVMTSWAAIPIVGNAKYSIKLKGRSSMALGLLAGTGSWAFPEFGLALPYVSYTYGDRRNNLTLSTGFAQVYYQNSVYNPNTGLNFDENQHEGRLLVSVAGMAKITDKFSLVFDSFISPWGPDVTRTQFEYGNFNPNTGNYDEIREVKVTEKSPGLAIFLPGVRWQMDADRAFQFGFTGFYYDDEFMPFPIPMVQWYRRL
jgi:hypothetical protein